MKVSIMCLSFNQKEYIKQCLDGFVNQKTNFAFEVLIHDDCSTDGTKEIIEEYVQKYPNIFKPFYEAENQYQKGKIIDVICDLYSRAQGKYIAQCEGDDYWCDEYKLQKQVDFMESHPDYALCYHPARMIYENSDKPAEIICTSKKKNPQSLKKLLMENNIAANSVMYRAECLKSELDSIPNDIYPPDWFFHLVVAMKGKIGYLSDVMYVYRRNEQGISYTQSNEPEEEIHSKYGLKELKFYYEINKRVKKDFPEYYENVFLEKLKDIVLVYAKKGMFDELKTIKDAYAEDIVNVKILPCANNLNKKKLKKYKKLYNIFLVLFVFWFLVCITLIVF